MIKQRTLERLSTLIMDSEGTFTGPDAQEEYNELWEIYELAWDKVNEMGVFKDA